jgi:hypothetical protein
MVWLQLAEACPFIHWNASEDAGFVSPVFGFAEVERELGLLPGSGSDGRRGYSIGHVVQGGPEVVDHVSSDESQVKREIGLLIDCMSAENVGEEPFVSFDGQSISVAIREGLGLAVKSFQMLPGALYFQPRPIQGMDHDALHA